MKSNEVISSSYLQSYGCLIIVDPNMKIRGISEQALKWYGSDADSLLGSAVGDYFKKTIGTSGSVGFQKIIGDLIDGRIPRQVVNKKTQGKEYYYKFSSYQGLVYVEWEEQHKKHISASRMDELAFLFDQTYPNNWAMVCQALNRLINFDRIFVLQVMETGHSKVIAEHVTHRAEPFKKKEFSRHFMPEDAISYYDGQSYRYTPNLRKSAQKFYSLDETIDTQRSQLAILPELHELYLTNAGVEAAVIFPLYLNGQFWGLVIAHCAKPKKIDLQTRKLCSFITQNAMSKYESRIQQGLLDYKLQIQEIEEQIKKEMTIQKTVNCALVRSMDVLKLMTRSDGIAIYNQGDVFFHGSCPKEDQFYEIIQYLQANTDKTIFKDYNFKLNQGYHIGGDLPFAGLLSYALGKDKEHYIVWFREEMSSIVTHMELGDAADPRGRSRKTIRIWDEAVHDSAMPWDESDLIFVESLRRIINESILHKVKERQLLTEELQSMNNELEMFTFTLSHDLRNPLSILGMGLQFLKGSDSQLTPDKRLEWYTNLMGSVSNIEDIINNIVTLSQSKVTAMTKDPIPMAYTIRRVSREMAMLHQKDDCLFHFGTLFPVWGEKSALYQIFLNLIGNAVKYSSTSRQAQVWIDSSKNGDTIQYRIRDNGIGIPANALPHVFEMFSRAENAQGFQGTGVGLSLVKRIIDRLGGSIIIRSEEGHGTEITLNFPLAGDFPSSMLTEMR